VQPTNGRLYRPCLYRPMINTRRFVRVGRWSAPTGLFVSAPGEMRIPPA